MVAGTSRSGVCLLLYIQRSASLQESQRRDDSPSLNGHMWCQQLSTAHRDVEDTHEPRPAAMSCGALRRTRPSISRETTPARARRGPKRPREPTLYAPRASRREVAVRVTALARPGPRPPPSAAQQFLWPKRHSPPAPVLASATRQSPLSSRLARQPPGASRPNFVRFLDCRTDLAGWRWSLRISPKPQTVPSGGRTATLSKIGRE